MNTVDVGGKITDNGRMLKITHLLALIDEFKRVKEPLSDTTLSFRVFGDSKKIAQMRTGSDITLGRFNEAFAWFSDNWPDGAVWPKGLSRPHPKVAA